MRTKTILTITTLSFALALGACDSKTDAKKDEKKADAKKDEKKADEKKADVKAEAKADAKAEPAADAKAAEPAADAKAVDPAAAGAPKNIVETAKAAGTFTTLITAVEKAGLVETLSGTDEYTVFAPSDEAFAKVDKAALDALIADPEKLKGVLLAHVVKGKVMAADASKLKEAETVGGTKLPIDATDGVKIGDAKVVTPDIAASNGVIHVIDTVILPK